MSWISSYGVLTCTIAGWLFSSLLKIPFTYFLHHKIDLKQAFGTGFDNPSFALAVAVSMVVLYDAAGVRRQAGMHAERINMIIKELFEGKPLEEKDLKEMLGHSPLEVTGGILTGILTALFVWIVWPK
jgi:acid phosphatase family membrane protein YuiD